MTTVSVVIAAYNAEGHLERAVDSALAQTAPPHEVLIVDDASSDDTLALARRLAGKHSAVRALAVEVNSGPAHARNVAIDAATGEWVAVLDADDVITPGRLAAMVDVGEGERADVVVDNFVFVAAGTGGMRPSRIPAGPGHEVVDRYRFFQAARAFNYEPTWTLLQPLLRRSFLDAHRIRYPTASRHGEDFLFMADVLLSGARCVRLRAPGYLYTERAAGWSTTRTDYDGLVAQTTALLTDPRVARDDRARRLLQRRLATLRCLQAERQGAVALVRAAVTSPGVAATLARRVGRRTARRLTRDEPEPLPSFL
jgi:hypothetical protein